MTESEVIQFLRIPELSNSKDYHNVIEKPETGSWAAQNSYLPEGTVSQESCLGMGGKTNRCWKIMHALWFVFPYNHTRIV